MKEMFMSDQLQIIRAFSLYVVCVFGVAFSVAGQTPTPSPTPAPTPAPKVDTSQQVPSAELPDEPPPVAPNFEAPARPLPNAERVGVDLTNQLSLSLDEAI